MLKLFIMRHADSHVHGYGGDDFGREISKKGILKTNLVVKELLKQKVYFDIIFTSPAKRTKQTLQILNKAFDKKKLKIVEDRNLYDGNLESILLKLKYIKEDVKNILLITHEPTIIDIMNFFTSNANSSSRKLPIIYNTSSVICLNFQLDTWEKISNINCRLGFYIDPDNNKFY